MSRALRILALAFFLSGAGAGLFFGLELARDDAYHRARLALERHPGHLLYQADYQVARGRHMALLFGTVACGMTAVVLPALFLPLARLLDRTSAAGPLAGLPSAEDREGPRQ